MSAPRDVLHDYWREPWDGRNGPATYTVPSADVRSAFLVDLFRRNVPQDASILEVGCNAGRNLAHLRGAGYENLAGVDISPAAVDLLRETYPHLDDVAIGIGPAEDVLAGLRDFSIDVLFTMAVLEHIHPDSEALFADMARVAGRCVVTIEDEKLTTWRHFPRDYRAVFEGLGLRQVEALECRNVKGLGRRFVARVFVR
jgi:SAM-dependent methyltransferase